jgi:phospholipid transport system substrate-binding protein
MLIAVLAMLWTPPPAAAAEDAPRAIVERLNDTLLGVMREAETLGYQGRFDRLAPALSEAFDFPLMARASLGRHWKALDDAQRARLIELFARSSVATFAARFDGFSGERFEVLGEKQGPRKSILVRNRLVKSDGEAVEINYLLRRRKARWQVVDIFLDAKYSEMALKRSEYTAVVQNEGFDALLVRLEARLAELAAEG